MYRINLLSVCNLCIRFVGRICACVLTWICFFFKFNLLSLLFLFLSIKGLFQQLNLFTLVSWLVKGTFYLIPLKKSSTLLEYYFILLFEGPYRAKDLALGEKLHHVKGWYISVWYSRWKKMLIMCSIPRPVRLQRADLEMLLCTLKHQLDRHTHSIHNSGCREKVNCHSRC